MSDKFRRAQTSRHIRIYHRQMQSEAWRHLSGSGVKVLLALAALEKGDNNGAFFLSVRTGAERTGLGKDAVNRALRELQDKGFMGNALTEDATAALIANGELRRHARKAWQVYAERRRNFAAELDRTLGDIVQYRIPDGGLAFWLRFPDIDLDALEERAWSKGLRFASSRSFMTRDDAPRGLRIGFASLNADEARTALGALREAAGC